MQNMQSTACGLQEGFLHSMAEQMKAVGNNLIVSGILNPSSCQSLLCVCFAVEVSPHIMSCTSTVAKCYQG